MPLVKISTNVQLDAAAVSAVVPWPELLITLKPPSDLVDANVHFLELGSSGRNPHFDG